MGLTQGRPFRRRCAAAATQWRLGAASGFEWVVVGVDADVRLVHLCAGLQVRDVQSGLGVEVDGWGHVVGTQTAFDGRFQNGDDGLFFVEFDLDFGRVNVDVDPRRVHRQIQGVQGMLSVGDQPVVGAHHSAVQKAMLDKSAIDKQELLPARLPCGVRFADKPLDGHHIGFLFDRDEAFVVLGAQNADNALPHGPGPQLKQVGPLVG